MNQRMQKATVRWLLFSFRGRIARRSYILGQLFMLSLLALVVARILAVRGDENATVFWGFAFIVLGAVSVWCSFPLMVKRLHDLSLPGALSLVVFVPTVNIVFLVLLMVLPSRQEVNEHGPPPFGLVEADGVQDNHSSTQ